MDILSTALFVCKTWLPFRSFNSGFVFFLLLSSSKCRQASGSSQILSFLDAWCFSSECVRLFWFTHGFCFDSWPMDWALWNSTWGGCMEPGRFPKDPLSSISIRHNWHKFDIYDAQFVVPEKLRPAECLCQSATCRNPHSTSGWSLVCSQRKCLGTTRRIHTKMVNFLHEVIRCNYELVKWGNISNLHSFASDMSTFASTVTHLDLDLVIDLADWMESELYQVKGVKIGMLSRRGGCPVSLQSWQTHSKDWKMIS